MTTRQLVKNFRNGRLGMRINKKLSEAALDLGCSSKYFTRVIKLETDRIDLKKQRKDSKLSHHDRHKIDSDIEYVDVKLDSLKKVAQDIEPRKMPQRWSKAIGKGRLPKRYSMTYQKMLRPGVAKATRLLLK